MNLKLLFCSVAVGLIVASCTDDNYDLSDVDTTSRVQVKDLVVPVNFDDVYLSDIIKIDDNSVIKVQNINGKDYYTVSKTGEFDSDPIYIESPEADAPALDSKVATLVGTDGTYPIEAMGNDFTFTCANVDAAIVEIENVQVSPLDFNIQFNTPAMATATVKNVRLQLPKGMKGSATAGTYDAVTGVWNIPSLAVTNKVAKATFTATYIDFTVNDFTFADRKFDFTSNFSILGADLVAADAASAPATTEFRADFSLTELDVTAVSGRIEYQVKGMDIESIRLNNLPTFLNNGETNLTLVNPMICLQTTNPVASDKLNFTSALSLAAVRDDVTQDAITSDIFTIGYDKGSDTPYNTVLSPENPTFVPSDFAVGYTWTAFPGLDKVVAGNGLPSSINVVADNPMIPNQSVTDFGLGRDIPGVHGSYEFFCPLAFADGSVIYYSDTKDGWNKDIEDLTISSLTLTAEATNNTPFDAQLTIYPLGVDGNRINGVELSSNVLKPGEPQEVVFTLSGEVKDLDGVEFFATIYAVDETTISPDQTIVFKNIRVKVNGYYEKKL